MLSLRDRRGRRGSEGKRGEKGEWIGERRLFISADLGRLVSADVGLAELQ